MKTTLTTLLLATALCGANAGFGSGSSELARATATVELVNPENFTDFKTSRIGGAADATYLAKELQREINRQAARIFPAGYRVLLRVSDVDLAGEFEPQQRAPYDDIRIMRAVYTPRMQLEYSVTDANGNVIAAGERTLTDLGYEYRLRTPVSNETLQIETEMVGDFFREIARGTS
jgi:hypothetical protein